MLMHRVNLNKYIACQQTIIRVKSDLDGSTVVILLMFLIHNYYKLARVVNLRPVADAQVRGRRWEQYGTLLNFLDII